MNEKQWALLSGELKLFKDRQDRLEATIKAHQSIIGDEHLTKIELLCLVAEVNCGVFGLLKGLLFLEAEKGS